eukprot:13258062-Alexandrium_andersonii.AAC.1
MSASLVGSEMCIRDSQIIRIGRSVRPRRHPGSLDERVVAQAPQEGTDAVSYTHLTLPTICSV